MVHWVPQVPERFGALAGGYDFLFSCRLGNCPGAVLIERAEALRRWGADSRVAQIAERMRCERCHRRGARVEIRRMTITRTEGERVRAKLLPIDRLVRDISDLRPMGKVS